MKYLIMTEGTCEKALLDILLERNMLIYDYFDLLYQQVFCARQIDNRLLEMINQLPYDEKLTIIRIGDKLSDKLDVTDVEGCLAGCFKICIKPEFEILHTINDDLFDEFIKQKSKKTVSSFYAEHNQNYKKTYKCNQVYFEEMANGQLIDLIKEYEHKRAHTHRKDELTLLSILKDSKLN